MAYHTSSMRIILNVTLKIASGKWKQIGNVLGWQDSSVGKSGCRPDGLSSDPRMHITEGAGWVPQVIVWLPHASSLYKRKQDFYCNKNIHLISLSNRISSVMRKKLPLKCSVPSSASFGSFVASFLQSALFNKSSAVRGKSTSLSSHVSLSHRTSYIICANWNARSSVQKSPATWHRGGWTQTLLLMPRRPGCVPGKPALPARETQPGK